MYTCILLFTIDKLFHIPEYSCVQYYTIINIPLIPIHNCRNRQSCCVEAVRAKENTNLAQIERIHIMVILPVQMNNVNLQQQHAGQTDIVSSCLPCPSYLTGLLGSCKVDHGGTSYSLWVSKNTHKRKQNKISTQKYKTYVSWSEF